MITPPDGWLECNGQAVSRTEYAILFHKIGTTFGEGDGETTFNLPDLRDRFVRGWKNNDRQFGSYQDDQIQNHTHQDGGHSHQGNASSGGEHSHNASSGYVGNHSHSGKSDTDGSHRHRIESERQNILSETHFSITVSNCWDKPSYREGYMDSAGSH